MVERALLAFGTPFNVRGEDLSVRASIIRMGANSYDVREAERRRMHLSDGARADISRQILARRDSR